MEDAHEERTALSVVLVKDVFDEIEEEADRGRLDGERERGVVDVAREDVDDARQVLDAQLPAHVVDEVRKR